MTASCSRPCGAAMTEDITYNIPGTRYKYMSICTDLLVLNILLLLSMLLILMLVRWTLQKCTDVLGDTQLGISVASSCSCRRVFNHRETHPTLFPSRLSPRKLWRTLPLSSTYSSSSAPGAILVNTLGTISIPRGYTNWRLEEVTISAMDGGWYTTMAGVRVMIKCKESSGMGTAWWHGPIRTAGRSRCSYKR